MKDKLGSLFQENISYVNASKNAKSSFYKDNNGRLILYIATTNRIGYNLE